MKRILLTILATGLAAGLLVTAAVAQNDRGQRAQAAPGQACKEHARGSDARRQCLREAAGRRGNGVRMRANGIMRACAEQHQRGTEAFRNCVRERMQARMAERKGQRGKGNSQRGQGNGQRGEGNGQRGGPFAACAENHARGSDAFRTCVRQTIERKQAAFRACKAQHADRSSQAFRDCMRAAKRR